MSPFDGVWLGALTESVITRLRREDLQESEEGAVRLRNMVDEAAAEPGGGLDIEADPIRGFGDLHPAFRMTPSVLAFCRSGVPEATIRVIQRRKPGF